MNSLLYFSVDKCHIFACSADLLFLLQQVTLTFNWILLTGDVPNPLYPFHESNWKLFENYRPVKESLVENFTERGLKWHDKHYCFLFPGYKFIVVATAITNSSRLIEALLDNHVWSLQTWRTETETFLQPLSCFPSSTAVTDEHMYKWSVSYKERTAKMYKMNKCFNTFVACFISLYLRAALLSVFQSKINNSLIVAWSVKLLLSYITTPSMTPVCLFLFMSCSAMGGSPCRTTGGAERSSPRSPAADADLTQHAQLQNEPIREQNAGMSVFWTVYKRTELRAAREATLRLSNKFWSFILLYQHTQQSLDINDEKEVRSKHFPPGSRVVKRKIMFVNDVK